MLDIAPPLPYLCNSIDIKFFSLSQYITISPYPMKNPIKSVSMPAMLILFLLPALLHGQAPVAVNDTVDITPGFPVTVNLLANDTITPGDSIKYFFSSPQFMFIKSTKNPDSTITFLLERWGYGGQRTGGYQIRDFTTGVNSNPAQVIFNVNDRSNAYLDINNISALFSSSGLHFLQDSAQYEAPKGSGKMSMFSNSVWIGGIDPGSTLHFAGERYRGGPNMGSVFNKRDFWAGPVSDTNGYNVIQDTIWNRVWRINKSEIDFHRAHYWEQGYTAPKDILEWPAHGDISLGQAPKLAPFSDRNANGSYEPYDGDYPEIRGDQALFFIYNDDHGYHAESTGEKLKVEVHGMAYAFDRPNDTAFKNTTFLHLKFYNRSNYNYSDSWMGVFTDIDLGYANDDFMGCDPERGMYYGYNGKPVDGTGKPSAYGENPPVQAVVILGGPRLDPDGYDNPSFRGSSLKGPSFKGSCDIVAQNGSLQTMRYGPGEIYEASFLVRSEAINGLHFGDSVIDNERLGMRRFVYQNNSNAGFPSYWLPYPAYAPEYYEMMNGFMSDGSKMIYGGNGHHSAGGYGPECDYMFPGLTDTCNWGTMGLLPNGLKEWTEKTAKNNPGDRRGMGSSGPFTFQAGSTQELDLAFAWARCYNPADSICVMHKINAVVDTIRRAFSLNRLPGGGVIYGLNETHKTEKGILIYPNPADRQVTIRTGATIDGTLTVEIRNMQGVLVARGREAITTGGNREVTVSTAGLSSGLYLLKISDGRDTVKKKLVISH